MGHSCHEDKVKGALYSNGTASSFRFTAYDNHLVYLRDVSVSSLEKVEAHSAAALLIFTVGIQFDMGVLIEVS
jgi:hypothetical protein